MKCIILFYLIYFIFGSNLLDSVLHNACYQRNPSVLHGTCNRPVPESWNSRSLDRSLSHCKRYVEQWRKRRNTIIDATIYTTPRADHPLFVTFLSSLEEVQINITAATIYSKIQIILNFKVHLKFKRSANLVIYHIFFRRPELLFCKINISYVNTCQIFISQNNRRLFLHEKTGVWINAVQHV